jgi:hypothetical protein
MRLKIEPMKKVAKMLRQHRPLLLNWFKAKKQFSSGIVAGFNNKAKLTTRKAYGFRTVLAKTKVVVARKTVAHKLARACFYMLRDQVEFDVNKAFDGIK